MKNLKLFEEYNEFYTEIGYAAYDDMTWEVKIDIENSESEKIKKFIKSRGLNYKFNFNPYKASVKIVIYEGKYPGEYLYQRKNGEKQNIITIVKCLDEWFAVDASYFSDEYQEDIVEKYYRCDQIEGLLKCLSDIIPDMFF